MWQIPVGNAAVLMCFHVYLPIFDHLPFPWLGVLKGIWGERTVGLESFPSG